MTRSPNMIVFRREYYLNFAMGLVTNSDEYWMDFAIKEAEKALDAGEIPVGAIVVHADKIIGKGHNQREGLKDPTAHAEMLAITSAATFFRFLAVRELYFICNVGTLSDVCRGYSECPNSASRFRCV